MIDVKSAEDIRIALLRVYVDRAIYGYVLNSFQNIIKRLQDGELSKQKDVPHQG